MRPAVRRGLAAALLGIAAAAAAAPAAAQDYEREARWAKETLDGLVAGEPVWLAQRNGHRFLALHQRAAGTPRGALIVAHGRGWAPDVDLYGELRTRLADAGWTTLAIQMPVLPGTAKIGDYIPTFPDASERLAIATDWLRAQGHARIAIVSHSLGSTMANHHLIRTADGKVGAWVMLGIINGLEDAFRLRIPVLDLYAEHDWEVIRVGADERRKQIERIRGSRQVMLPGAQHFFEGRRDALVREIAAFLDAVPPAAPAPAPAPAPKR